ncbi:MAG: dTDP-4-dehydrorhamnose reductase [Desulfobacula sp.]|nr:dTDP-4-dehydrorhamnose reductase [Desulfobacula sp.]
MNILLIGRTGQLGHSILKENTVHRIFSPDRTELDIESRKSCQKMIAELCPDVVINTAAFHNVPQCEIEQHRAFKVNCLAVRDLALACKKTGALLITFSTDYVFDGMQNVPYQEDDRTNPLQIYGISKLCGEFAALATAPEHAVVIRTCGLYGLVGASSKGGNFVDQRISDAQNHIQLEMGCDQIISPTYTVDLAKALLKLIEHPGIVPGIYHLVNEGACTWFEFTQAIYELMDINIKLYPVDRGGMSGEMQRPLYSALANTKAGALGITLPHRRDALKCYLAEKYGSVAMK